MLSFLEFGDLAKIAMFHVENLSDFWLKVKYESRFVKNPSIFFIAFTTMQRNLVNSCMFLFNFSY